MRRSPAVLCLLLLWSTEALGQQDAGPPPVLVLTRESFKPGHMAAHNRHIPAFHALFEKAKVGNYRLGLVPIAGDQNHLLYLEGYPSWAEVETTARKMEETLGGSPALQAEMDALTAKTDTLHDSQTAWMAIFRGDLSYRPNTRERTGQARYFTVTTTRVNIGRATDYADYVKQTNAARVKADLDEHTAVYQVLTGAPAGTFLTLSTARSLSEIDDAVRDNAARTRKLTEALGGEVVVKQRQNAIGEIVAQTATATYSIDRALSRPRPEFVTADPEFWKPKAAPKKEPARK
jgi:hypothetical protein